MNEHKWVSISVAEVQVLPDTAGKPMVFDLLPHTPSRVMYGCDRCHEPLESAYGKSCKPEEEK